MSTFQMPYHSTVMELSVDDKNLEAVITAKLDIQTDRSEYQIASEALRNPIGSPRLRELARGKKRVTIVTSDHTRAMPSQITMPLLLKEIREGNPEAEITILIATGLHRKTTLEEQKERFGEEIVAHEHIVVNDAFCREDFDFVTELPSGAELWVNRAALECDLLVTEGFIEPHFFAGFSGGRKSVLPGICNAATVNENHSFRALASPYATAGELDRNPVHIDMLAAAKAVKVSFIFNVALDPEKKIVAAFAGDLELAHAQGVAFVRKGAEQPRVEGDIVVTSNGGYPLDQNLYQSPKAVSTAEACCREGGVIVIFCACCDGMGGEYFGKLATMGTPKEIENYLSAIPPRESIPEQWSAQVYARVLQHHKVILVTDFLDHELVRKANIIPVKTAEEAMEQAYQIMGKDARVVVIPDGVSVLIAREDE